MDGKRIINYNLLTNCLFRNGVCNSLRSEPLALNGFLRNKTDPCQNLRPSMFNILIASHSLLFNSQKTPLISNDFANREIPSFLFLLKRQVSTHA